jgi:hypothetical protein
MSGTNTFLYVKETKALNINLSFDTQKRRKFIESLKVSLKTSRKRRFFDIFFLFRLAKSERVKFRMNFRYSRLLSSKKKKNNQRQHPIKFLFESTERK